jgi:hypothetical protein
MVPILNKKKRKKKKKSKKKKKTCQNKKCKKRTSTTWHRPWQLIMECKFLGPSHPNNLALPWANDCASVLSSSGGLYRGSVAQGWSQTNWGLSQIWDGSRIRGLTPTIISSLQRWSAILDFPWFSTGAISVSTISGADSISESFPKWKDTPTYSQIRTGWAIQAEEFSSLF